ncbi:C45 family autoproteolytic acyltransferase/hydolase [Streptomyces wedmorensis]|uniref:C45 family autoproteolytic acyltransferase/hydolase n=1 Tax=Streptomyces wedmorensis TaxID=43759 RepID=UPI0037B3FB6F
MTGRTVLRITGDTPRRRGEDRGRRAAAAIARAWRVYDELFATVAAGSAGSAGSVASAGISGAARSLDVRALALRTADATRAWAPELVEEMEGVAEGAGLPFWTVAALNARTEILAEAGAPRAGECSTLVRTGLRTTGGQCWDWHEELAGAWHLQTVTGDAQGFAGITEHGILAKIGVNDAGVGVLFNILGHAEDAATGVPVHLVARQVLGTAGSFAEAVGILTGAPVSASTVITVVTADRAASVELAPAGSAVVEPDERGWLTRTNHFLDPPLAAGELRGRREPETYDRHRLLTRRVLGHPGPLDPEALVKLLAAHRDDGAEVCCHAPAEGTLGSRWATLATVAVDPAERRLLVHDGGPCTAGPSTWTPLTAPAR